MSAMHVFSLKVHSPTVEVFLSLFLSFHSPALVSAGQWSCMVRESWNGLLKQLFYIGTTLPKFHPKKMFGWKYLEIALCNFLEGVTHCTLLIGKQQPSNGVWLKLVLSSLSY